jgi:hypothetical protein
MVVLVILALVFAVMGILVLAGKGDNLIAGYNTASREEREQIDIKRLRGLVGGLLIVLAPLMILLLGNETMASAGSFGAIVFVLCIVVVILANTWAKKKSQ